MRYYSLIISLLLPLCSSYGSPPVSTPARFGGLDTLTKAARLDSRRAENERLKPSKFGGNMTQGTLIEDPRVIFSTYCGGNGYDCGNSLAVDSHGDVYIVGYTGSGNFPVSDDAWQKEKKGGHDMFLGKFTASGARVWLTYFGGSNTDVAVECIADKDDNLIVVGKTNSTDFPTTEGVEQAAAQGGIDVVIVKFSPDGKLLWSRYYGGYNDEVGEGIALCNNGTDFVITGSTLSMNNINGKNGLPIVKGTYQDTIATYNATTLYFHADAFLAKFDGNGKMIWGTYFGGVMEESAHAVAIDKDDNIAIVGEVYKPDIFTTPVFPTTPDAFRRDSCSKKDIFYSKFSPQCKLLYSTRYCGSGGEETDDPNDYATDVKFDGDGSAVFCGYTGSKLFPTTPDAYKPKYDSFDAVLVKFSKDNQRVWSTYYGGKESYHAYVGADYSYSLDIDNNNNIWIAGITFCTDFFVSNDAIQKRDPENDMEYDYLSKFSFTGFPLWTSVYCWRSNNKIIINNTDNLYFAGETNGNKFLVTNDAFQNNTGGGDADGFLVHINLSDTAVPDNDYQNSSITLYPNPVDNTLTIKSEDECCFDICIFNILGIELFRTNQQSFPYQIDISKLPTGAYFIKLLNEKNQITLPFIKKS